MRYPKKVSLVSRTLKEHKAESVTVINVKDKTPLADYYVICSARNKRHLRALAEAVEDALEENKIPVHHVEGPEESGWILIDAFDVIINLFSTEERERISLEKLYSAKEEA